jgi:(2R)-3-sulfolactate dehydrogenase (NADP+)
MTMTVRLSIEEIGRLAERALTKSGASGLAAARVANAVAAAERDGIASHGMAYVPTYCEHLGCGKVNRNAAPRSTVDAAIVKVDADSGFAHPAITLGFSDLVPLARDLGIAVMAVQNSYNCGVLGYHTEHLAEQGLVALGFTNSPASIAAWGGRRPVFGTNPWSLAVPSRSGGAAFVLDQSASVVAKSEVMKHQRKGEPIPLGWALDSEGQPTTDPAAALAGTMVPAGGYKGVGSALLVEVMAACLTGATLGISASPFSGPAGGPPRTGQCFIAFDPDRSSGGLFGTRLEAICDAIAAEPNARLPGSRRFDARTRAIQNGVDVDKTLVDRVIALGT